MKIKDIKNKVSGVGIAAFVAILALLFVTVDQKSDINGLQAELENAEVGISSVESEYLDTIAEFEGTIKTYELELVSIRDVLQASDNELAVFKAELQTTESVVNQLAEQLVTAKATIIDLQENPNCPVTQ
jgi:chromosome segregation ATPase|tara:strand:- start:1408 stop:1797 length:390 start_codon:yes stop_codon:yes gene_type:complete